MPKLKNRTRLPAQPLLQVLGVIGILLLALALLWHGNAHSNQAVSPMMAQVRFEGEYRIGDGQWQPIVEGEHIPASKGDVTLQGNFHMYAPDGLYVGLYDGEVPIALYTNHISLTICEKGQEPFVMDMENPLYGDSACGEAWTAYTVTGTEGPIRILIHNPHRFGNEMAVDELLAGTAFWANIDFEKEALQAGEAQRNTGLFFVIVSLVLLGVALFCTLIHIKNFKLLWILGAVVMFAGTYLVYSASGVSFWQSSIVSNTTILGGAMVFYMFFLSLAIVFFLEGSKKLGGITVTCLGAADALLLACPIVSKVYFYDTWIYWVGFQLLANGVLMGCLVWELCQGKKRINWLYVGAMLPLLAFAVDVVMTGLGLWQGGVVSEYVFIALYAVTIVLVLRVIPRGINAAAKAKELETEKTMLDAQLKESRVSTMMSQIRPHFIYNTLGSIEQLCELDPEKAGELVHNFAKYLRGNFGELDNPSPIQMSQEMEHVQYYISIEKVRFPDMTFLFEMNSVDFRLPALTIQPIVENAVKHGLMKRENGGTIRVVSYETDTHYCVLVEDDGAGFDTGVLLDDRAHMGIRNIRERLKAMVNGTVTIESQVGVGTKALIAIPKEVEE